MNNSIGVNVIGVPVIKLEVIFNEMAMVYDSEKCAGWFQLKISSLWVEWIPSILHSSSPQFYMYIIYTDINMGPWFGVTVSLYDQRVLSVVLRETPWWTSCLSSCVIRWAPNGRWCCRDNLIACATKPAAPPSTNQLIPSCWQQGWGC